MSFTLISFQVVQGIYVQMSVCWLIMFNCQSLGKEILLEIFNCCSKFRAILTKAWKALKIIYFLHSVAKVLWGGGALASPGNHPGSPTCCHPHMEPSCKAQPGISKTTCRVFPGSCWCRGELTEEGLIQRLQRIYSVQRFGAPKQVRTVALTRWQRARVSLGSGYQ